MTDLPRSASAKLTQLTISADEAEVLAASTQARIRELDEQISLAADRDDLGDLKREQEALKDARAKHQRRRDNLKSVVAHVRHWLERVPPNSPLEYMQPVIARPQKDESVKEAIDRTRASIDGLRVELQMAKQALPPKGDLKLSASKYVEGLIAKAKPTVRLTADGVQVRWNQTLAGPPTSSDIAGIVAFMDNGAALKKKLHEMIEQSDHRNSMSREDKTNLVDKLRIDILRLEREEEALVELAVELGTPVDRRPDANPAAILGVKIGKPKGKVEPVKHPKELADYMERTA